MPAQSSGAAWHAARRRLTAPTWHMTSNATRNRRRVRSHALEGKPLSAQSFQPPCDGHVAIALQEILGFDDKEKDRTIATLTDVLERSRKL